MAPEEIFVPEKSYPDYITNLDGLMGRIVDAIPLEPRMRVLDAAAGTAWFSAELAKRDPTLKIVAIDTSERVVKAVERRVKEKWLDSSITTMKMNATLLDFQPSTFGVVTNFSGLSRVHMMHGAQGVRQSIHEAARVLRPHGYMCFTIIPPEEAETVAQRLECETYSYACGLTWLPAIRYQEYLRGAGFSLVKRVTFYTGKKLDGAQAKQQLESTIEKTKSLEVEALTIDEVWERYGADIEKEGLGHCSRVVLMIARKNA